MTVNILNPSTLVVGSALVSDTNPLPCTNTASTPAGSGGVVLNPRDLVYNGAPVTSANPLPISLV